MMDGSVSFDGLLAVTGRNSTYTAGLAAAVGTLTAGAAVGARAVVISTDPLDRALLEVELTMGPLLQRFGYTERTYRPCE